MAFSSPRRFDLTSFSFTPRRRSDPPSPQITPQRTFNNNNNSPNQQQQHHHPSPSPLLPRTDSKIDWTDRNIFSAASLSRLQTHVLQEQHDEKMQIQDETERCLPPLPKSIYEITTVLAGSSAAAAAGGGAASSSSSSSSQQNSVVLQNTTLCKFGGLTQHLHLIFLKVPSIEGQLPCNYELYLSECRALKVAAVEALLKSLSVTPGRYDLKVLSAFCSAAFQDRGVDSIVPLIHHNRARLESLQLQCSGITDAGLTTLLEALTTDELPAETRDNVAVAENTGSRFKRLVENGGHWSDLHHHHHHHSHSNNNNNHSNKNSLNDSLNNTTTTTATTRMRAAAEDDDASQIASPKSQSIGDVIKMNKLRIGVVGLIARNCSRLKTMNLSGNAGLTDLSVRSLCLFLREHPNVTGLNLQKTSISVAGQTKIRETMRRRQMQNKQQQQQQQQQHHQPFYSPGTETHASSVTSRPVSATSFSLDRSAASFNGATLSSLARGPSGASFRKMWNSQIQREKQKMKFDYTMVVDEGNDDEDEEINGDNDDDDTCSSVMSRCVSSSSFGTFPISFSRLSSRLAASTRPPTGSTTRPTSGRAGGGARASPAAGAAQLPPVVPRPPAGAPKSLSRAALASSVATTSACSSPRQQQQQQQQKSQLNSSLRKNTKTNNTTTSSSSPSIDAASFASDVALFTLMMNPVSGMIEIERISSRFPHIVNKILQHILSERTKVEEKLHRETLQAAQTRAVQTGGAALRALFSRSKLPLAHVPELTRELTASSQAALALIERTPELSLDTVNFWVFFQSRHPTVAPLDLERAIMKHCQFAHADTVKRTLSALETVPLPVTVEALEIFHMLDRDDDGFITLQDCIDASSTDDGAEAARFVFERFGFTAGVQRKDFFSFLYPTLLSLCSK